MDLFSAEMFWVSIYPKFHATKIFCYMVYNIIASYVISTNDLWYLHWYRSWENEVKLLNLYVEI